MLFESRHIKEFLGIDKNRLFFWTQTKRLIRPEQEEKGRGGRSKFSFENLLDLALIQELSGFGIELNAVGKIIRAESMVVKSTESVGNPSGVITKGRTPWEVLKEEKEKLSGKSLFLFVAKKGKKYFWSYRKGEDVFIEGNIDIPENWDPKTVLMIDLSQIERDLNDAMKIGL